MTYQPHQSEDATLKPVSKTGWPPPALAQDDSRPLFRWFASKLDARRRSTPKIARHPFRGWDKDGIR